MLNHQYDSLVRPRWTLADQVTIPPRYTMTGSGQFDYMERAAARLRLVAPATLLIIFLLLYLNFRNITEPVIVMLSIPFWLVGGIWLVYGYGYNISLAVAVGFIDLAGMAAEIGVLVLSFIDVEIDKRRARAKKALSATSKRVRPEAMTAISTMAGLIPIMLSSGTGSDVTHRIASPCWEEC